MHDGEYVSPTFLIPPWGPGVLNQQQVELECKAHNLLAAVKAGLTQTVPKQQWRPVSENELAYTIASAQSWVHAYVIQKAAH